MTRCRTHITKHRIRREPRRGAALLEVVLSLGLLIVAMGVIGMAFTNGQFFVERAEARTRAMLMTEKLITEIDTGVLTLEDREDSGYFIFDGVEESIPGMSWRVEVEPHERIAGLLNVDISIYMGDPEDEELRRNLLQTRIVRAEPRGFDFERDFGMDEEQIEQLTSLIPGGAQLLDPTNFDPRALAQLPIDQLIEMLPTIMQAFGGQLGAGQLEQLMDMVQSGNLGDLQSAVGGGGQDGGGDRSANEPDAGAPDELDAVDERTGRPGRGGRR